MNRSMRKEQTSKYPTERMPESKLHRKNALCSFHAFLGAAAPVLMSAGAAGSALNSPRCSLCTSATYTLSSAAFFALEPSIFN